jgi:phosphatidylserine decarboxylase
MTSAPSHAAHAASSRPAEAPAAIIAPEGWPIVAGFLVGSALLIVAASWLTGPIGGSIAAAIFLLVDLWCIWFFRDPQRRIPTEADAVICPADGKVVIIDRAAPPAELGLPAAPMQRICIFMNVFNVHVNRSPVDGRVERISYRPGKFFNASFDKASTDNERCSLLIRMQDGRQAVCVQIAGLIARRIVCRVKEGVLLSGGERFGLIRFGSRVDVYLPVGTTPAVNVGDITSAGSTIIARLAAPGAKE